MTKKELQERLLMEVLFGNPLLVEIKMEQERPYTMVKVNVLDLLMSDNDLREIFFATKDRWGIPVYPEAIGWAKCNWPDKFNPDYGYNLCVQRAVSKIAKMLVYR